MAKATRIIDAKGIQLEIPRYVIRTVSGWQVRIRGISSAHFSDSTYGGARESLHVAASEVGKMVKKRFLETSKQYLLSE